MKKAIFLLLAIVCIACSKVVSENPEESIVIEDSQMEKPSFDASGGVSKVLFYANHDWTVHVKTVKSSGWCNVTPMSGPKGDAELTISVEQNNTGLDRSVEVVLACGEEEYAFSIEQEGKLSEDAVLTFRDINFKKAVCQLLKKEVDADLYLSDLSEITELDISDRKIQWMDDLKYFDHVQILKAQKNQFIDLPLTYLNLANLKSVSCVDNNHLQRVWLCDEFDINDLEISKPNQANFAILASPNHFSAPLEGATYNLYLRPGITEVEFVEKCDWASVSPIWDDDSKNIQYWELKVNPSTKAKHVKLRVKSNTAKYGEEEELIYVYVSNRTDTPKSATLFGKGSEDGIIRVANEKRHKEYEDIKDEVIDTNKEHRWNVNMQCKYVDGDTFVFGPNLEEFSMEVEAYVDGVPAEWRLTGVGFYFPVNKGIGKQTITAYIDGNPRTRKQFREISLTFGDLRVEIDVEQEGVEFEMVAHETTESFDYVTAQDIYDDKWRADGLIYFPPQQSSGYIDLYSNANFVDRNMEYITGQKFNNDTSPAIYASNPNSGCVRYEFVYSPNYNYVDNPRNFVFFEDPWDAQAFKKRGVYVTFHPCVQVFNWSDMTIGYSRIKDNSGLEVGSDCRIVQQEIRLDHEGDYYMAGPMSGETSSSCNVYSYVDEFNQVKQLTNKLKFSSNVHWEIDTDRLRDYGLNMSSSYSSYSDGYHLVDKVISPTLMARDVEYGEDIIDGSPIPRSSGYEPSILVPFVFKMDLGDGNGMYYPICPGFIGQSGFPKLQIQFTDNFLDGISWGPFWLDGEEYPHLLDYDVLISTELDAVVETFIEPYFLHITALADFAEYNVKFGCYESPYILDSFHFTWYLNPASYLGRAWLYLQHDLYAPFIDGGFIAAESYVTKEFNYVYKKSSSSASSSSIVSESQPKSVNLDKSDFSQNVDGKFKCKEEKPLLVEHKKTLVPLPAPKKVREEILATKTSVTPLSGIDSLTDKSVELK